MKTSLVLTIGCLLTACGAGGPTDVRMPPPPPPSPSEIVFGRNLSVPDGGIGGSSASGSDLRALTMNFRDHRPLFDSPRNRIYFMRENDHLWRMDEDGSNPMSVVRIFENHIRLWDLHPTAGILIRGGSAIWKVDLDGQDLTQLTPTIFAGLQTWPKWSPDGTEISYLRRGFGVPDDLWVMSADGTNQQLLAESLNLIRDHDWHPDGSRLIAPLETAAGRDLFVVQTDGSGGAQVTTSGHAWDPEWSPDGTQIVFRDGASSPDYVIVVADADGTNQQIIAEGEDPGWSPDGSLIAYCRSVLGSIFGLATIKSDGTDAINLVSNGNECLSNELRGGGYAWRP